MSASSISADEFITVMTRLGPFEKNPIIAVGVSGGADSMALLHLAHDWAQLQGGKVVALTIDHNIRAESATEAAQVGMWCTALGIEYIILKWDNPDASGAALQQRARGARYTMLEEAASARGILHLLIAHHQGDQAETVLLRLAKGSGPDGLAGMSAIVHKPQVRVLRPLLGFPKERLLATCRTHGQNWIEDPSNASSRFARPRLRAAGDMLAEEGLTPHHLALTAAASGRTRAAMERATAALLGRRACILPQGYAELTLSDEDSEIQLRALAELVQTIGGGAYQANAVALDEILLKLSFPSPAGRGSEAYACGISAAVRGLGSGRWGKVPSPVSLSPRRAKRNLPLPEGEENFRHTLGGCLIERSENKLLIIRENRNIELEQTVKPSQLMQWDRFKIWTREACTIGALGNHLPEDAVTTLPKTILASQPAFRRQGMVTAIPTIGYYADPGLQSHYKAWFSPKVASGKADFAIV